MNVPEGTAITLPMLAAGRPHVFSDYLSEVRPLIDRRIEVVISAPHYREWVGPGLRDLFSKGKRMRGGLLLLTYSAFAKQDGSFDEALDLAASIEIAHSVSLVLDDMIDGDSIRRGQRAVHIIDGQRETMLGMVGALSIPYSITSRHGGAFTELLASTHRSMVNGEMAELRSISDDGLRESYDNIIALKTGQLFSLAARFGAMAARCAPEKVEHLARFGLLSGMVVQLADDIDDLELDPSHWSTGHGSELLLARLLAGSDHPGTERTGIRQKAMRMLDDRITEAGRALALALEGGERTSDSAAERLFYAPAEMALMMHAEPTRERSGVSGDP